MSLNILTYHAASQGDESRSLRSCQIMHATPRRYQSLARHHKDQACKHIMITVIHATVEAVATEILQVNVVILGREDKEKSVLSSQFAEYVPH